MVPRADHIDQLDPTDDMEETVEITEVEVRRAGIEQTRADISETLDAIKDKLQPQTLMQQAKETAQEVTANVAEKAKETAHEVVEKAKEAVQEAREAIPEAAHNAVSSAVDTAKEAVGGVVDSAKVAVGGAVDTAKDAGTKVVDTVRENPWPYALIGLGLGMLYMNSRRAPFATRHYREQYASEYRPVSDALPSDGDYTYRTADEIDTWPGTSTRSNLDLLRARDQRAEHSTVADTLGHAREKIGEVKDVMQEKAGHMAEQAREKAEHVAEQAREKVSYLGARTTEQARDMAYSIQRTWEQSPLMIGAIAMGIGAAIGFMMPETQPENRLMGETRDRLVEQAQQKVHEVKEKVQAVASETLDTAKEKVQTAAEETLGAAKEEAREQGLTA